jgi:hypothetical protein
MSIIAEQVFEAIKNLPDQDAAEVLDFVEFLKAKRREKALANPDRRQGLYDGAAFDREGLGDEEKPVTPEEHAAWCERLRRLVESQPMTDGDIAARMRQEARY